MSTLPIRAAYEHHGVVRRPCPQCGAGPNRWRMNTAGRLHRVPASCGSTPAPRPGNDLKQTSLLAAAVVMTAVASHKRPRNPNP